MTDPVTVEKALERAKRWLETASEAEKKAMWDAQRESWARGPHGPTDGMGTVYYPAPRQEFDASPSREPREDEVERAVRAFFRKGEELFWVPLGKEPRPIEDMEAESPESMAQLRQCMAAAIAALTLPEQPRPVDDVERIRLPRLTDKMIRAACQAHYGSDAIDGINLTVADCDYTFRMGFQRMWAGIRSALGHKDRGGE